MPSVKIKKRKSGCS